VYLVKQISVNVCMLFITNRDQQNRLNDQLRLATPQMDDMKAKFCGLKARVDDINKSVQQNNEFLEEQSKKIDTLVRVFDRNMAMMSLHAAKHLKECPHLVWITPVVSGAWRNPRNWVNPIMVTSDLHLRSLISTR
jgi:hypothetical protein